jgi:hypothetical protein
MDLQRGARRGQDFPYRPLADAETLKILQQKKLGSSKKNHWLSRRFERQISYKRRLLRLLAEEEAKGQQFVVKPKSAK